MIPESLPSDVVTPAPDPVGEALPDPTETAPHWFSWRPWATVGALVLIVLLGAWFRLNGVDWDQGTHLHPDERFLTMVVSTITLPGTDATRQPPPGCAHWGGYFDTACSPLDPYSYQEFPLFVYGTFPIFLTRFVGMLVDQTGYDQIHFVGRILSALFDLSTVLFIFFIGRRMYGVRAGLLGALFLACSVLDIQQSHFFTVDTFTNVPILMAFWFALDIVDGKRYAPSRVETALVLGLLALCCFAFVGIIPGLFMFLLLALIYVLVLRMDGFVPASFVFAGLAFGLALAGRINIAPFAAVLVAAAALYAYRRAAQAWQARPVRTLADGPEPIVSSAAADESDVISHELGPVSVTYAWREPVERISESFDGALARVGSNALGGLISAALVALVVFRVFQPYAANGPDFVSPHLPSLDLSRGPVNVLFDVVLAWAGGVNEKFADNMSYVSQLVAGTIDSPPGIQWTDRTPYLFPLENMVLWGLGLPLGIAGWAGFLVALYQLLRYRRWEHLLIVVWVGITFGYTGQQFVKTMRYFLQIYPFMALLAGWFLVQLWDWAVAATGGRRTVFRGVAAVAAVVVVGYTLFWAAAFAGIYTRDYTRVAASKWIFDNVPAHSAIGNELWDDAMPTRVQGKDPYGGTYTGVDMSWYDEDTPEKRIKAIGWLDRADYVILSSNRLYGSIPRVPMRWPMTTKYYEWLFDGTLGFQQVAVFTSRPQLFGIEIRDDDADEAYTVYDHPKVTIFKKTAAFSHEKTEALFNGVDLSEVYRFTPPVATRAKTALLLTPSDRTAQVRGGTFTDLFDSNDLINRIPVVGWLLMIEVLSWLCVPLAYVVFRGLSDRGYVFAKALGLLLPAWGAWIQGSLHLVGFGRQSIVGVVLLVALANTFLAWRFRSEMFAFLRSRWRLLLSIEALFLLFFGLDLAIRFGNPDLWHPYLGGEKPMDFAYLNALAKSTWFPPYDPWFAGGYVNYYYFGQLITATMLRLSGIVPEVAYNLALPTYFALLAMGAFSVVYNLAARMHSPANEADTSLQPGSDAWTPMGLGLLGALLVAVIGNLGQVVLIVQTFFKIGGGQDAQGPVSVLVNTLMGVVRVVLGDQPFEVGLGSWYWNASRVIPDTINEFPFFTFLYADLHAHLMALPFTLLVIGIAVNMVLRPRNDDARLPFWPHWQISPVDLLEVVVAALALGSLRAINYADYVTYPLIIAVGLLVGEYARHHNGPDSLSGADLLDGAVAVTWRLIAILGLSILFYQPFISHFTTTSTSIEIWKGARTNVLEYLTVHGIFLFVTASYLIWQGSRTRALAGTWRSARSLLAHLPRWARFLGLRRALACSSGWYGDLILVAIAGTVVAEAVLILMHAGVFALVVPLLVLAGLLVVDPDLEPGPRFITVLIAAGMALTLAVELVRYKDDIGRMNTVFKFYLEVWVFLAIASAAGLAHMVRDDGTDALPASRDEPASIAGPVPDAIVTGVSAVSVLRPRPPARGPVFGWFSLAWWATLCALLFAGMLYPVFAARAKVHDRMVSNAAPGLNGMDYQLDATYREQDQPIDLRWDHDAIEWLRANVSGSPVIAEGNGPLYHWTSRVSVYTGLPTIIGWDWHQKQQRSIIDGAIVDHRIQDVRALYSTAQVPAAIEIVKRYQVSYIYVGDFERIYYGSAGLAKFDTMAESGQLKTVYESEHVKIYQVQDLGG